MDYKNEFCKIQLFGFLVQIVMKFGLLIFVRLKKVCKLQHSSAQFNAWLQECENAIIRKKRNGKIVKW